MCVFMLSAKAGWPYRLVKCVVDDGGVGWVL